MRFRYTFDVQSNTRLDSTLQFTWDGYDFRLQPENGRLTKIVVTSPNATVPLDWFALRQHTSYTDPPDPFFEKVQSWLRVVNGALGLRGVADIGLDECLREFIPSTVDENAKMQRKSMRYERFRRNQLPLGDYIPDFVLQCVLCYETIRDYEIPLEFHRRGQNDLLGGQYVDAIVNFFFVLEYLFSDGQYQTKQLIKNFQRSSQLTDGLAEARRQMSRQLRGANPAAQQKYQQRYGNTTNEQVIKTIVEELRGFLHHQSAKRSQTWHPTVQRDYGVDAHFLGAVSQYVLLNSVDELFGSDAAKEKLNATKVVRSETTPLGSPAPGTA